jgi:hypothetical protein
MADSNFGVEKVVGTSFYRVHAVPIGRKGKLYTVELQTDFLDGGSAKTQDQWAQFSKEQLSAGNYGYLSAPQFRGLAHVLRVNKDHPKAGAMAREITDFLRQQHRARVLITSSRVDYMPSGKDVVTHEYGLDGEHKVKATILGPDECLHETTNPQGYQALFGTNEDITEIIQDFQHLNGTNTYAWKVNSPNPRTKDTRVVRLDADSDGFNVHCYWNPQSEDSALGGKVFAEGVAKK